MRRPSPPLHRAVLTILVMAALLLQGVPLHRAEAAAVSQSEMASPCHDASVAAGQMQHAPNPAKADPFACCATFACGMLLQALPPQQLPVRVDFKARFDRPAAANGRRGRDPAPAWRPPDTFI